METRYIKSLKNKKMSSIDTITQYTENLEANTMLPIVRKMIIEDCLINSYKTVVESNDKTIETLTKQTGENDLTIIIPMFTLVLPNGYTVYIQKN